MEDKILSGSEGRKALLVGINTVADAVKITLGAMGRNAVIGDVHGNTRFTKDGVTVARSINLDNMIENMGASLIKEVAAKTVDVSGDGTTTATILAQSIIQLGLQAIDEGANPVDLKKGIEIATADAIEFLKSISKPVDSNDILNQIASISANNDNEIGKIISDAVEAVGYDGLISVERSNSNDTFFSVVKGLEINQGYTSYEFVTNPKNMTVELENPFILICDNKISAVKDILGLLEYIGSKSRSLLIISDGVEGEALGVLISNKLQGRLKVAVIKTPHGGQKTQILEDVAAITGGTFISESKSISLEDCDETFLGEAKKVIITKDKCNIIDGNGKVPLIAERVEIIEANILESKDEYELGVFRKRLSGLKSGAAVISIGGITPSEVEQKKDRIDDAVCATKAAIQEGFVAGGGTAFVFTGEYLKKKYAAKKYDNLGANVLISALSHPFVQILNNGGYSSEDILNNLKQIIYSGNIDYPTKQYGDGINIKTSQWVNMFEDGIIDPTMVLRIALENASSIATLFLTSESVILERQQIHY
jgi:chaperonin GroEL